MRNFMFVERLLEGTKCGKVEWNEFNGSNSGLSIKYSKAFSCRRNGNYIIIAKEDNRDSEESGQDNYCLVITDNIYNELYLITEKNLTDGDDPDSSVIMTNRESLVLSRLYRVAERNSKKIDKLLEKLAADLPEPEPEDELPF